MQITGKEREVVQLLAERKTSKEVAMMLYVSVKTVEMITELVRYAFRNHIVDA